MSYAWEYPHDVQEDCTFIDGVQARGVGTSLKHSVANNLEVSADTFSDQDPLRVSVTVTNSGEIAGKEVVQLYVRDESASVIRPVKELRG